MGITDTSLPRSHAALQRLEQALNRLDNAVSSRDAEYPDQVADVATDLAEELRRARADYARLDDASRLVEQRLDGVIGHLRLMIED